jgi:hypothetical protein
LSLITSVTRNPSAAIGCRKFTALWDFAWHPPNMGDTIGKKNAEMVA